MNTAEIANFIVIVCTDLIMYTVTFFISPGDISRVYKDLISGDNTGI